MHKLVKVLGSKATWGEWLLAVYVLVVIACTVAQLFLGPPVLHLLSSSPAALVHGRWWTLITSSFIIDGPKLPQVVAVLTLGAIAIYTGGAWVFWRVALAGHILGTLLTYLGLWLAWLANPSGWQRLINAPDYGVSLIWCAALGAIAAVAWRGTNRQAHFRPYLPATFIGCWLILFFITWLSVGLAAYEHDLAFILGYVIMYLHYPTRAHCTRAITGGHFPLKA